MSDRAATEAKFVELLETDRSSILPQILDGYDSYEPPVTRCSK